MHRAFPTGGMARPTKPEKAIQLEQYRPRPLHGRHEAGLQAVLQLDVQAGLAHLALAVLRLHHLLHVA